MDRKSILEALRYCHWLARERGGYLVAARMGFCRTSLQTALVNIRTGG